MTLSPRLALASLALLTGCQISGADSGGADPTGEATAEVEAPSGAYADLVARYGEDYDSCGESRETLPGACGEASTSSASPEDLRVELILDASGSMAGQVGGESKMEAARDALTSFAGTIPDGAGVALRVYGHRGSNSQADKERSCAGTELLQEFGPLDEPAFERAVSSFQATGWTPIAASLDAAAQDFAGAGGGEHVVYLVSDGIETCDGDPVAAARRLHQSGVRAVVNVIGFDVDADAARQLRAVAEAGGGTFIQANSRADLWEAFNETYASAWERYNCVYGEQWGAYNETYQDQWGRYNCLYRKAWDEYNAIYQEAWRQNNADEMDDETRRDVIAQARAKREGIIEPAREERERVVGGARERRSETVDDAREERSGRVGAAREERDGAPAP